MDMDDNLYSRLGEEVELVSEGDYKMETYVISRDGYYSLVEIINLSEEENRPIRIDIEDGIVKVWLEHYDWYPSIVFYEESKGVFTKISRLKKNSKQFR